MELPSYVLLTEAAAVLANKLHTRHPFPRVGNQTPFDGTDMGHELTQLEGAPDQR